MNVGRAPASTSNGRRIWRAPTAVRARPVPASTAASTPDWSRVRSPSCPSSRRSSSLSTTWSPIATSGPFLAVPRVARWIHVVPRRLGHPHVQAARSSRRLSVESRGVDDGRRLVRAGAGVGGNKKGRAVKAYQDWCGQLADTVHQSSLVAERRQPNVPGAALRRRCADRRHGRRTERLAAREPNLLRVDGARPRGWVGCESGRAP